MFTHDHTDNSSSHRVILYFSPLADFLVHQVDGIQSSHSIAYDTQFVKQGYLALGRNGQTS